MLTNTGNGRFVKSPQWVHVLMVESCKQLFTIKALKRELSISKYNTGLLD